MDLMERRVVAEALEELVEDLAANKGQPSAHYFDNFLMLAKRPEKEMWEVPGLYLAYTAADGLRDYFAPEVGIIEKERGYENLVGWSVHLVLGLVQLKAHVISGHD